MHFIYERPSEFQENQDDFSRSGVTIYDPQTSRPNPNGPGIIRDPFAAKVIPGNRICPTARKVIALYPSPNVAGACANNFIGTSKLSSDTDQFDVRVGTRSLRTIVSLDG